ncbi:MAG: hypothetical protein JW900_01550 [Anaerolineae bacterium]|nr:hypothetical protein [Anaerolineae bacterium]
MPENRNPFDDDLGRDPLDLGGRKEMGAGSGGGSFLDPSYDDALRILGQASEIPPIFEQRPRMMDNSEAADLAPRLTALRAVGAGPAVEALIAALQERPPDREKLDHLRRQLEADAGAADALRRLCDHPAVQARLGGEPAASGLPAVDVGALLGSESDGEPGDGPAAADERQGSQKRLLYFNGLDGQTGAYSLPPMTAEALAEHILGDPHHYAPPERQYQGLARDLGRNERQRNATVVAITQLLAHGNLGEQMDGLVDVLVGLLGSAYGAPDQRAALERRLAGHTADKVVDIVRCLVHNDLDSLFKLLLSDPDEEPDNLRVLKEHLKQDAKDKIDEIRARIRQARADPRYGADASLRHGWLAAVFNELRTVPIAGINAINDVARLQERIRIRGLGPLLDAVDALESSGCPAEWAALRADLSAHPADLSWSLLLDQLEQRWPPLVERSGAAWGDLLVLLDGWLSRMLDPLKQAGVREGIDPLDLAQAGWGIVFPYEDPAAPQKVPEIKKALAPLLERRESQAGRYYRLYEGKHGYRPQESAAEFLGRHGAEPAQPADPERAPYYLLLVGSPEEIPFHFQYQLDVQYAVGRIDFGDDWAAYANYARSVVAAETGQVQRGRRAVFFSTVNGSDEATRQNTESLVQPLHEQLEKQYGGEWELTPLLRQQATKQALCQVLQDEPPALLFTASHGIEFAKDDPQQRQVPCQGALVCQEWPGPDGEQEIPPAYYLSGGDLGEEFDLGGMIAFFFACYSAGTPRYDEYYRQRYKARGETIADSPFIAALPKAMLSLSRGGALAVIGHVERAWGTSFLGQRGTEQISHFQGAVERILKGQTVGWAMEYFNGRYAALSTELVSVLENADPDLGMAPDPYELAEMWTANNDARGYIVLGDPAVRLHIA